MVLLGMSIISCSTKSIKENEVGVVVSSGGEFKVYRSGEQPSVMPFFQKFYTISVEPAILSFVGDEGVEVVLEDGRKVNIESQVTYFIRDAEKVVKKFGYEDVQNKIRERIKHEVSTFLSKSFARPGSFNETSHRIQTMAEINILLNETMNPEGINISSFNIRHE